MARWLLDMAADETTPPAVRLAAIKDALDRAGLSPRQALDVVHELKPWEKIMEGLALDGVARGPNGGAAPAVVDGEIVPDGLAEFGDGRSA